MRSLIKLGLILVVAILGYNYFFGDPQEKAQSKEIFKKVGELGKASWSLLKSEKAKLDDGKYDTAIDKIGNVYDDLRSRARSSNDRESLQRLSELEQERLDLEQRIAEIDAEKDRQAGSKRPLTTTLVADEKELKIDLRRLLSDTETLMRQMEKE
ncbi:hypothetical protein [Haliscomenobacter sp.]|uniref:hypothetical protein n=1 Tax=Haliscomenobacter sp. TaxID=2717303 RepID=UPI0035942FDB